MSQEKLAELSGLNYKYIGRVELGKAGAGADVLVRLARGLAVPVGDLFEDVTHPRSDTNRLSPADVEELSRALEALAAVVRRVADGQPSPLPSRAPRHRTR